MAHEQSITIGMDGQFYNIPTVHEGKKVSDEAAVQLFRQGKLKHLGTYPTQEEAIKAAQARSESFGIGVDLQKNLESVKQFLKSLMGF